jgi:hypothetical protein
MAPSIGKGIASGLKPAKVLIQKRYSEDVRGQPHLRREMSPDDRGPNARSFGDGQHGLTSRAAAIRFHPTVWLKQTVG